MTFLQVVGIAVLVNILLPPLLEVLTIVVAKIWVWLEGLSK